jgi:hypothetical protein
MKSFAYLLLSLLPTLALSWITNSPSARALQRTSVTTLQVSNAEFDTSDTDKPCWQDIWSYDCTMSTAYSAAFIPADWIKKLPCALGLADCDTPETLKRPAPADGSGVEQVDVMQFLDIKRAGPLKTKNDE